jgi:hypothetical protein
MRLERCGTYAVEAPGGETADWDPNIHAAGEWVSRWRLYQR